MSKQRDSQQGYADCPSKIAGILHDNFVAQAIAIYCVYKHSHHGGTTQLARIGQKLKMQTGSGPQAGDALIDLVDFCARKLRWDSLLCLFTSSSWHCY